MGIGEVKKPDRMVSHADAMDFATAVARASGWPLDEQEDFRRASEAWDAQEEDEEEFELEDVKDLASEYVPVEYVQVTFYLTVAEAQDWIGSKLPPWWVAPTVEQYLRKARTQP